MLQVNIHEAKTNLSSLIANAVNGESFIIAKSGKPLVKVTALDEHNDLKPRTGFLKGNYSIPDDFNEMCSDEIHSMFYGDN